MCCAEAVVAAEVYRELSEPDNYQQQINEDSPMSANPFYHRDQYAADLAQQLLKPTALQVQVRSGVFLSGIRRIGKTTFLRQDLIPALEAKGALVIYVDLWADRSKSPASLWYMRPCAPPCRHWLRPAPSCWSGSKV